jgi:hypothetical protein
MKAYSVAKVRGQIQANSRQSITGKAGLTASTDNQLTFVDGPNDTDRANLAKLGLSLIQTTKEDLYLVVGAEAEFVW